MLPSNIKRSDIHASYIKTPYLILKSAPDAPFTNMDQF